MQRCTSCKKCYHDVCQTLTVVQKELNSKPGTVLLCKDCKSNSHEESLSSPLLASTPAHPVAGTKAQTLAKRDGSRMQRKDTSNSKVNQSLIKKNDNKSTSNPKNNNSNHNISNNSSSTASLSATRYTPPANTHVTSRLHVPAKQTIKQKSEVDGKVTQTKRSRACALKDISSSMSKNPNSQNTPKHRPCYHVHG